MLRGSKPCYVNELLLLSEQMMAPSHALDLGPQSCRKATYHDELKICHGSTCACCSQAVPGFSATLGVSMRGLTLAVDGTYTVGLSRQTLPEVGHNYVQEVLCAACNCCSLGAHSPVTGLRDLSGSGMRSPGLQPAVRV